MFHMNLHNTRSWVVFSILLLGVALGAREGKAQESAEKETLHPMLEPLRPLMGKTWKGTFKNSTPEKPVVDVMKCERALNGQAVRLLHSINQGLYGGETLIIADPKKKKVVYYYFTTAGFMTIGTMEFNGNKIVTLEKVEGGGGGIAEVKGESERLPDGKLHVKTEHLKDGKWEPGHEATYEPDPAAQVVFK